jgi:fibronectin type 3 domain-containing protein
MREKFLQGLRAVLVFCAFSLLLLPAAVRAQTFVQVNDAVPANGASVGVLYGAAQTSGNLNVVIVGWNDTVATVTSVTDTKGNTYVRAVGPTVLAAGLTQSIYYAKNIAGAAAGANTVTVQFSTSATYPDIRIIEYSGLDVNNPLDSFSAAIGTAVAMDSGAAVTTNANDLLVGANIVLTSTAAAGSGFSTRIITSPDGDIAEDKLLTAVGSYHATATLSNSGGWIMQAMAFKAAGAAPAPTAPGSLTATTVSSSQINLGWTASTESGGTIASYLVERCSGAGCSSFVQVGSTPITSYSDTGLASGTSYNYRVRAQDTASNLGPYSTTVTAMTAGTAVPTAPGSLAAVAGASGPQVIATQSYIYSISLTSHTTAAFDSTGGDMLVLCASSHEGVTMTPSDTFGNSWISVAGPTSTSTGFDLRTQVWYARMPVVGPGEEVTMTLSIAQPLVMSIIVVKGSNISSPLDVVSGIGDDAGTQNMAVSSPNITTTAVSDLLIGFAKSSIGETWTAGTGFTTQLAASTNYLDAETGFAATPGVYAATFAINAAATWQSAVVAVSPSASAGNPNQVNLTWTASTETGGTISAYLVERCQGTGCTTFSQIGTTTLLTYNDTNVTAGTSYTYRVRASDAFNIDGPYSNSVSVVTAGAPVPTAPTNLTATALSATAVSLSWTASTEAGGTISSYLVERCQGSGCTNFAQIGTSPSTTFSDTVLTASTVYNYRVRAEDAANNIGPYSTVAAATTAGVPNVASLSPSSGGIGTVVTITGTNFGSGLPTVTFNNTISAPTSSSPTTIVVPVPTGATTGNVVVTVASVASNGVNFTVLPISVSVSPSTATVSTGGQLGLTATLQNAPPLSDVTWTVSGAGCTGSACGTVTPNPAGPRTGIYTAPATLPTPGTVLVTATSQADSTKSATATITLVQTPAPSISSLNPTSGPIGSQVTITGTNFGATQGSNFVSTSAGSAPVISWSNTSIVITIPTSLAGFANTMISVSVNQLSSNQVNFGILSVPNITSLNPAFGPVGVSVTISGANFGATQGTSTVSFNGVPATPTSWSATSILVPVPTGATTGPLVVNVGGSATNGVSFTVTPSISGLNPASGPAFSSVTVTGSNFGASQGASTVTFGGIGVAPTSWSNSSFVVIVPNFPVGSEGVQVMVSGFGSNAVAFQVKPAITSLSPTSGPPTTSVTISGTSFGVTQGVSTVMFNGATATPISWGDNSIVVPVPAGATTGNVVVTVGGQASNSMVFTVTLPTPPSNLTASVVSSTQVNLSWTASTESGGTISKYLVERCQGTGCSTFAQIGTSTSTTYADSGLIGSTVYQYRVRAQDAVGTLGPYSSTAAATTAAPVITAPQSLAATVVSAAQINLSWTAATETGGTISSYLVERCSGANCTSFAQIGTSTTTTYNDTGLTGSTSYSYRVRVKDTAGNTGPYSTTASGTTTAPVISAPGGLAATAASSSQINLSWTASTETGGAIASYLVERCTGAACTTFARIGTSTTTTYTDTGLTASTSYSYRVRVKDAAGNTGPYSATASGTTPSGGSSGSIAFVQVNSAVPATGATVGVAYTKAQVAGDLNVVIVGWNDTTATVKSVVDTKGNTYLLATGPVTVSGSLTQSIYYAKNIAGATAGANTVTVTFSTTATYPDIRILEYSGLDTNSPFDGGMGATGTATTTDSGGLTTTNANDLLVGANIVLTSTSAAGTGFTSRVITYPDGDIAEDEVVSAVGTYHATTKLNGAGGWITQVVAFKAAGAAPAPTAPGSLTATTISSSQINLGWTASTESGGTIASYLVERCSGAGCSSFAQVGTSASTSYGDTGLASGTSYSYRVRAQDTASNLGPYSTTVTAMTAGTAVPTAPGSLAAIAGASGPQVINTQSYIYSALITSHTTAAFDSTGGDLLVLCASSHAGVTMTPSDTFGNSWISVAGPTNTSTGFDLRTQVWYARMPVVGPGEEVTMTLSAAQSLVMSIIVVKGSNAPSPLDVVSLIGDDAGTQSMAVSSPNITTTATSDLLIGFAKSSIGETWTAGTGFTTQVAASTNYLDAETGFAATPGVYAATFAINAAATWQSAVVAVSPSASAGNPNQVNLTWTASTETGGTIGAYLVDRCQGVGCTTFSQIGTTTLLTYNDTNVTAGTSYTYRVRASDAFNIDGPYSSTVSVTAK